MNQSALTRIVRRVVDVRPDELGALAWSSAYFFCLLSAYYIIRPLRETLGVAGGVRNLPWLFTGTMVAMLVAHPPFAAIVARLPRGRFVSLTYRFFEANLLLFLALLATLPEGRAIWVGRAFFVWTSVFNLFVVSIFWAFMADVFRPDQGRRLFGFIGAGGTIGAMAGAAATALLAERIGPLRLLVGSVLLLELAVFCVRRLAALSPTVRDEPGGPDVPAERVIGGSALAGVAHTLRSPYLLGICAYLLLFTMGSTVLYFEQADLAARAFDETAARTSFFARIDFAVNALALLTQVFLTGRIIRLLGVGGTLSLLPALSIVGFLSLAAAPGLVVFVVFQVLRRAGEYAVARPTREVLFTVVSREEKFKAKSFIDTFVYRGGDQVGAWSYALLMGFGLGLSAIALVAAPLAAIWLLLGLALGRAQARREGAPEPRFAPQHT